MTDGPEHKIDSRRRTRLGQQLAMANDPPRPSFSEYWSSDKGRNSFGVVELDKAESSVGVSHVNNDASDPSQKDHGSEARIGSVIWGLSTLSEARTLAALFNRMVMLTQTEKWRYKKLVYIGIPAPPCIIHTMDGTLQFSLPANMPLASDSTQVRTLLAQMTERLAPTLRTETTESAASLVKYITDQLKTHRPKLTPTVRAAWADDFIRYAFKCEWQNENREGDGGDVVPEGGEQQQDIPHDATLWEEMLQAHVLEVVRTINTIWRDYHQDRRVLLLLLQKIEDADFELPMEMLGEAPGFFVTQPDKKCKHIRLALGPSFMENNRRRAEAALIASRGNVQERRARAEQEARRIRAKEEKARLKLLEQQKQEEEERKLKQKKKLSLTKKSQIQQQVVSDHEDEQDEEQEGQENEDDANNNNSNENEQSEVPLMDEVDFDD